MLNRSAHQKLATLKPGTIADTKSISSAFITKVKIPSVKIFIGKVMEKNSDIIYRVIRNVANVGFAVAHNQIYAEVIREAPTAAFHYCSL